ncbi:MAG: hypothetical protein ACRC62_30275 [Microcoleus sp.]
MNISRINLITLMPGTKVPIALHPNYTLPNIWVRSSSVVAWLSIAISALPNGWGSAGGICH